MVTAEQVWDALEEIPDPEIPVISLVELGVIRSVDVRGGHVCVELTPTFLGCPALEVMRDRMAAAIRDLGAEPQIDEQVSPGVPLSGPSSHSSPQSSMPLPHSST